MKTFTTAVIRGLLNQVHREEISFSRMIEIMNERVSERVSEAEKPCVEDIPVRKFKAGDRVRIKEGVSSKTHRDIGPAFVEEMDDLIGKTMTVERDTDGDNYVKCEGTYWSFIEEWLEPYEELKKGDLAIFWNNRKEYAVIKFYERLDESNEYFRHIDNIGIGWANAIKFESIEQYRKLLNGEI